MLGFPESCGGGSSAPLPQLLEFSGKSLTQRCTIQSLPLLQMFQCQQVSPIPLWSMCFLQAGVFVLVFGLSESACQPCKSWFPIPCISRVMFPGHIPCSCSKPGIWRACSPVQDLRVGVPHVVLESLTFYGKVSYLCDPTNCRSPQFGVIVFPLMRLYLCLSYAFSDILLPCVVKILVIQSPGLCQRDLLYIQICYVHGRRDIS